MRATSASTSRSCRFRRDSALRLRSESCRRTCPFLARLRRCRSRKRDWCAYRLRSATVESIVCPAPFYRCRRYSYRNDPLVAEALARRALARVEAIVQRRDLAARDGHDHKLEGAVAARRLLLDQALRRTRRTGRCGGTAYPARSSQRPASPEPASRRATAGWPLAGAVAVGASPETHSPGVIGSRCRRRRLPSRIDTDHPRVDVLVFKLFDLLGDVGASIDVVVVEGDAHEQAGVTSRRAHICR
jgi:hypothetical protein